MPLVNVSYLTGGFRTFRAWYNDTNYVVRP
jgi:hypothetical protein